MYKWGVARMGVRVNGFIWVGSTCKFLNVSQADCLKVETLGKFLMFRGEGGTAGMGEFDAASLTARAEGVVAADIVDGRPSVGWEIVVGLGAPDEDYVGLEGFENLGGVGSGTAVIVGGVIGVAGVGGGGSLDEVVEGDTIPEVEGLGGSDVVLTVEDLVEGEDGALHPSLGFSTASSEVEVTACHILGEELAAPHGRGGEVVMDAALGAEFARVGAIVAVADYEDTWVGGLVVVANPWLKIWHGCGCFSRLIIPFSVKPNCWYSCYRCGLF